MIFEPEDFNARLAAPVPKGRGRLTRFHGVFASASPNRAKIVPGTRTAACAAIDEIRKMVDELERAL